MWHDPGHSKILCDRTRTFREHPGLTLAHVPLLRRGRSKPPVFPLHPPPPPITHLGTMLHRHRLGSSNISGHTRWEHGQVWLRWLTCTVRDRIKSQMLSPTCQRQVPQCFFSLQPTTSAPIYPVAAGCGYSTGRGHTLGSWNEHDGLSYLLFLLLLLL